MTRIISGFGKYFRMGSKDNRHKLIIDDIKIDDKIKKEIEIAEEKHNLDPDKYSRKRLQDYIRNKNIEIHVR